MENIRIRLVFEDRHTLSKSQRSQGLKRSWLLLKPDQHPNFSDLSDHLLHIFDLRQSCSNGILLHMDDFVLPPFESTSILKENDIISVKKKGGTSNDIVIIGDTAEELVVEKQPVHTCVPLLTTQEFEKEAGSYISESKGDERQSEEPLENSSGGKAFTKKRKASSKLQSSKKKKHRVVVCDSLDKDDGLDWIVTNHDDGDFSRKNPHDKEKASHSKSKRLMEGTPPNAGGNMTHPKSTASEKSDQLQDKDERNDDMPHATNTTRQIPSRSARRKKAKRQWLRAMANIGKEEMVCPSEEPLRRKQKQAKVDKNELPCQSNGLLHLKQSHDKHHDKKIEHEIPGQKCDGEDDIVPIVIRPGHIRFEPLEEGQGVQENQVSMESFQWNGITSKRKGQKWGTEKICTAERYVHQNSNQDHSNMLTAEKEIPVKDAIDFDKLLPLPSIPKDGDVIAYRLLELSSTWTPELSDFRVGKVLWYKPESRAILLMPVPEYPVILEKLDDDAPALEPDTSIYKEDGSLEIDFSSLLDVRIVKYSNTDSAQAVADKVDEGPPSNTDAITNETPSTNAIQKHSPKAGDGEVNLWEHFSDVLNAKKAQLLEENSWIKGSSSPSSWSYRALRGSALGPTMALLRSNNGI